MFSKRIRKRTFADLGKPDRAVPLLDGARSSKGDEQNDALKTKDPQAAAHRRSREEAGSGRGADKPEQLRLFDHPHGCSTLFASRREIASPADKASWLWFVRVKPPVRVGLLTVAALLQIFSTQPSRANEARRVALVVGASAYTAAPKLENTKADATDIAAALRRLDFEVDLVLDPDRAQLENAIRRLGQRAAGTDAALFYFAGHGLEVAGRNWILPVSAHPNTARDLPFEALDLGLIFDQLDGAARVSLFFLDACRDSPFRQLLASNSRGAPLGGMRAELAAAGSLIVYATAPGREAYDGKGPHSPFTGALLKHIERPGLTVHQMLNAVRADVRTETGGKQVPWQSSALEGEFYFKTEPRSIPASVPPGAMSPTLSNTSADELFFQSIKDSRNPDELRAYLTRFPNGVYEPLVRVWLAQRDASKTASPGTPTPPDLGERLARTLGTALVSMPVTERTALVKRFIDAPPNGRALAVYAPSGAHALATGFGAAQAARDDALDRCAFTAGRPCVLLAVESRILVDGPRDAWPRHDVPWLTYTGLFDPKLLPLVPENVRTRQDILGYRGQKSPKAAAWRPGMVFTAIADTQAAAEYNALEMCHSIKDPNAKKCHLYAIGDGVVLPRWYMAPATPRLRPNVAPDMAKLVEPAGLVGPVVAQGVNFTYTHTQAHRALAVNLTSERYYWWDGASNPELASRLALEGCQIQYNSPCVLLAVNLDPQAADPRVAAPRPMERATYSGPFRLDRVPIAMESVKEVRDYTTLPGERAIAIRPNKGLVKVVFGKASKAEAERDVLAACNPPNDNSPCFLYASGNQVVLPSRITEPRP